MDRPDIVTLVIHHPLRPFSCLQRCLQTLESATTRSHLVTVFVQGPKGCLPSKKLCGSTEVHYLGEHVGPAIPRIKSVNRALELGAQWWAKLDDDAAIPEGSWDDLIDLLEEHGEDFGWAMANPNGILRPRNMETTTGALTLTERPAPSGTTVHECEFIGDGATVFRMEMFEEGLAYDPAFVRGADIDLAMQAKLMGWGALLVDDPTSQHFHKECTTEEYEKLRYDAEEVWRAAREFRTKWGLDCPHLSQFTPRRAR